MKTVAMLALGVVLVGWVAVRAEDSQPHGIPKQFIPVDTSAVLGSPDPLPLEAVRAFDKLKFERPIELTHAGDGSGRLFVAEQQGLVRVFENRSDVAEATTFLDIREVTLRKGNEEGLLGLAFHPKFKQNGEFFVYYSTQEKDTPRASIVSRFKVSKDNPNKADRDSEERLLKIDQPYENHNGGSLRFGHDGMLYIGLGDGGLADDPQSHAQNLSTLLGSILRIDVDRQDEGLEYGVPKDNPFVGRRDARGEIWAYGLRNVWRLAVDRKTGDLWAADVGQNRFEEINRIEKGGNYGWNIREGFHDFEPNTPAKSTGLIDPVVEYFRGEGGSVTGGQVYRGSRLKGYDGAYFYADYLSGNVWIVRLDGQQVTDDRKVARTGLQVMAFGEDAEGEMYLCAFDGRIYQLQPRKIDLKKVAAAFPRKLSETGFFASVKDNEPAAGLIPYEVNLPFWSDYSVKDRYIALPAKGQVKFDAQDKWQFPVGTVFVKTFWMHRDRENLADPVRLETRLLVNSPDEGWVGYTYVYNDDRSEAHLLDGSKIEPIEVQTTEGKYTQRYYYPSRSDCLACHTKQEGFVLGMTTRQMNRVLNYRGQRENQIDLLSRLGAFQEQPSEKTEELEKYPDWGFGNLDRSGSDDKRERQAKPSCEDASTLARAWLDVNCAMCHRPEGIAPGNRDLRFHAPLAKMNLMNSVPKQGKLSPPGTSLIAPGDPHASELLYRIGHRGPRQMPPLASNLVDPHGLEVVRQWIAELEAEDAKERP